MAPLDIERLKILTNQHETMLWINIGADRGSVTATVLEAQGFKVNRFARCDQSELKQYLDNPKRVSSEPEIPHESHQ